MRISGILLFVGTLAISSFGFAESTSFNSDIATSAALNDDRPTYHLDSWLALGITLLAIMITVMLNHAVARVRTIGTLLAAIACFGTAVWFLLAVQTGIVAAPKVTALPTDAAKPAILWTIALLSTLGGLLLLWTTTRQHLRSDTISLTIGNTSEVYGLASRYLHWTTAILFLSLVPMGIFASMIPEEVEWRRGYYVVHKTIGFIVLILVVIRIGWHLISARPAFSSAMHGWEKLLARAAHYSLYFLMLALPITGFVMSTYGGKPSQFFIWELPLFWKENPETLRFYGLLHKLILPYLFFVIFAAHILGALKHHFVDRRPESIRGIVS